MTLSPPLSRNITSSSECCCSISSISARFMDGSSRIAVCGHPPVARPMTMFSGSNPWFVARFFRILSASSFDMTSFDMIQILYPRPAMIGTIFSISMLFPEPTCPPIPILGILCDMLCYKHFGIDFFMLHLMQVCLWCELPYLKMIFGNRLRNCFAYFRFECVDYLLALYVLDNSKAKCRTNHTNYKSIAQHQAGILFWNAKKI